jgi:hypothetical protein
VLIRLVVYNPNAMWTAAKSKPARTWGQIGDFPEAVGENPAYPTSTWGGGSGFTVIYGVAAPVKPPRMGDDLGRRPNADVSNSYRLGAWQWQVGGGPALVLLTMPGHWVIGALANNQWSYAGWGRNNVNALLIQPFINYNFPDGWYVTSSPIVTANWLAASDNRWTLPIGAGFGKIIKLGGKLPINLQLKAFDNVVTPQRGGADWQLRFQVQFLFAK